jgi:hypothetical protein
MSLVRKLSIGMAVLGLVVLALPSVAGASPTVALKVKVVPIPVNPSVANGPTYPGTGDILGAGAAFEGELSISGTEYGGFPSPVTGVTVLAPAGVKLDTQGFATCSNAVLESHEVAHCPKKSVLGAGSVEGVVSFGSTEVHENLTLQGFFAPGGEIAFYAEGRSPAVIEVLGKGSLTNAGGAFGPKFSAVVPLVETVPGAPYGVVELIKCKIGTAFKQGKKLISYATLPKTCPKGGFPAEVELKFLTGEPVTAEVKLPCP